VTVAGSARSRLFLFAGLYFAQGVPWGFFTVAIMLRLTTLGLGPALLAEISSIALLPWILKPLFGLLVDRVSFGRLGRRRPYILLAEAGMAVSLLAMAFADPTQGLFLFGILLFIHNLFAAAQDVGTDALAIDILPQNERGRANGFMSAGKFAGALVGGQGLLFIANQAGWHVAYGIAIALLLVPALLVVRLHETDVQRAPIRLFHDILRLLSIRIVLIAAFFAIVVDVSDYFLNPLMFPLLRQKLHYTEQQVATLATVGSTIAALSSVAGGWLSDRIGRRRTLLIGCLGVAGFNLLFALMQNQWGNYGFLLGFTATSAVSSGIVSASITALFMDLTHPKLAATHFQLAMALLNARSYWGTRVGGQLAERLPPTSMFGLAALLEIVPLVVLFFLDPHKAKQELNPNPPTT
jgi:PAT family beta-lactamase induction signal transducer AmpG